MYRVELKVRFFIGDAAVDYEFLMYRVELKDGGLTNSFVSSVCS